MFPTRNVTHEDTDLTVINFAQATAPLPSHADRLLPFLGERRRIKNDHALGLADLFADLLRQRCQ
jgi:hypothetical protein